MAIGGQESDFDAGHHARPEQGRLEFLDRTSVRKGLSDRRPLKLVTMCGICSKNRLGIDLRLSAPPANIAISHIHCNVVRL